jgi:hypothetical protein
LWLVAAAAADQVQALEGEVVLVVLELELDFP